jgi:prepilin-type N-terminal cleavage/methylation domain-containing protein
MTYQLGTTTIRVMFKSTSTKAQSGFTLVEILVAITIMSFMMISVYTIVDGNINTKETVIKEDREFLQIYIAFHRVDLDISQIYSPLYFSSLDLPKPNSNGTAPQNNNSNQNTPNQFIPTQLFPKETVKQHLIPLFEQEDKTSFTFMTSANKRYIQDQRQSRYAWVSYSLESDPKPIKPEGPKMWVRRSIAEGIYDPNLDLDAVKPQVLLRGVKELIIEFWSRKRTDWVDRLSLLGSEERNTPRAVRFTVTWLDTNGNERTNIRVFRPMWPYFDAVKDETEKQTSSNPTPGPGGQTP